MSVSVLIPAFNAVPFITEALDSVRQQTSQPNEVIILDDASSDGTLKLIEKWSRQHHYPLKILKHKQNAGIGAARHDLTVAAKSDYITFLSADDYWQPTFLTKLSLAASPDAAAYCAYYFCDSKLQPVKLSSTSLKKYDDKMIIAWALKKNMFINFSGVLIPRTVLSQVRFLPFLRYGEDLIFLLDTIKAGLSWKFVPEPLLYYRLHSGMMSNKIELAHRTLLWRILWCRLKLLGVPSLKIYVAYVMWFVKRRLKYLYNVCFSLCFRRK